MGLDTSHDCWHGPYSSFMRWRVTLADAAGIPLMLMEGFYEPPEEDLIARTEPRTSAFRAVQGGGFMADRNSLTSALADAAERGDAGRWEGWTANFRNTLPLSWGLFKPDPLFVLLDHSDCEGEIAAKDCAPLADRLAELVDDLPEGDLPGDPRPLTMRFINGLRRAAEAGEAVDFH